MPVSRETRSGPTVETATANPTITDAQPETEAAATEEPKRTFHDSVSGKAVTQSGEYTDGSGSVEKHRIVSDNWPNERDQSIKSPPAN